MDVALVPVTEETRELLRRLLEFNAYEFSRLDGRSLDAHGEYGYQFLDEYGDAADTRRAFIISCDDEIAGCALVRRGPPHSVAEFFVLPKFRRCGVGTTAARAVLSTWPGEWSTHQVPGHEAAVEFWRQAVEVPYLETVTDDGTRQRFVMPGRSGSPHGT